MADVPRRGALRPRRTFRRRGRVAGRPLVSIFRVRPDARGAGPRYRVYGIGCDCGVGVGVGTRRGGVVSGGTVPWGASGVGGGIPFGGKIGEPFGGMPIGPQLGPQPSRTGPSLTDVTPRSMHSLPHG